eukprot:TRINITY_DN61876_c0_g2_i2.p1 TRINITY_DN61876_c0_g2~~TRINITY_DN61876_c0_g2_i2.p1  ORF type:complete len:114 (+),score=10.58 TRINITY_DN61876_c0_g2_i2:308-649(+)
MRTMDETQISARMAGAGGGLVFHRLDAGVLRVTGQLGRCHCQAVVEISNSTFHFCSVGLSSGCGSGVHQDGVRQAPSKAWTRPFMRGLQDDQLEESIAYSGNMPALFSGDSIR